MMYRRSSILALLTALYFSPAHAQQESLADRFDREIRDGVKTPSWWQQIHSAMLGKQYWVEPRERSNFPVEFLGVAADGTPTDHRFVLSERISFTVVGFVVYKYHNHVKVSFADGRIGFMEENMDFDRTGRLFKQQFELGDETPRYDWKEYIFSSDPEEVYAKERAALATKRVAEEKGARIAHAAEAARRARGGVRVGMSMKQVRASSWGAPQDVHRVTTAHAVTEQWVYEGGNYLYFENGILKAIQN
jgi:hypothetical protein